MENIAQSIKILSELIEKKANSELAQHNITLGQARILILLLKSSSQISLKDLERLFNVSQATMQGTISRMEKKGYICTVYMKGDKKTKYTVLTDYGRELAEDILKVIADMNSWISQPLSENEKKEFLRMINKIHNSITSSDII
ncbi:MAG: winged helix-turn-helix transcriptional regulator [Ruminococcaceae bacterium]|nr:winged helix-turn-helix transcriptional regulator [Oscillospiraceae bacterium]